MKTPPDPVGELLERGIRQMLRAERILESIEHQHRSLLGEVERLFAVAEDLERDRNRWRSKAEENELKYRSAARRAAELAYEAGKLACNECGSENLAIIHGTFPTGVTAPDGGEEARYECAIDCQECGHKEECVP